MADVLTHPPALGAHPGPDGTTFRAWTTKASRLEVVLYGDDGAERARHAMASRGDGLFELTLPDVGVGDRYKLALDGDAFPDPYARFLPEGVHGPAEIFRPAYDFQHPAPALKPSQRVFYELHVGTFTPEGTYAAAAAKLPLLADLGVTAIELLPVSAFPGHRGWGYDGVAAFAPQADYGRPEALMALVDEAHRLGLEIWLDAVYNHFGPDGNYLWVYSPTYFTPKHKTPWGDAINFENPYMRRLVLDAAEQWLYGYGFDGLRLDATHAIVDDSPKHILAELAERVEQRGGKALIAEDGRNEPALVTETGLDGLWADDFHHMVRVLLTGEQDGYYADFKPRVADLARTIERGWLYEGQALPTSPEEHRGKPADGLAPHHFVYCIQNHDQVGNRAMGDRLSQDVSLTPYVAVSVLLLCLPMTPLLFMGQEWAASTPFCFFSDHHGELGEAVSRGRLEEFKHFAAFRDPQARKRIPDPQAPGTFEASKLDWAERDRDPHRNVFTAYRELLWLRREDPVIAHASRAAIKAGAAGEVLWVRLAHAGQERLVLVNFGDETRLSALEGVEAAGMRPLFTSLTAPEDHLPRHGAMLLGDRA